MSLIKEVSYTIINKPECWRCPLNYGWFNPEAHSWEGSGRNITLNIKNLKIGCFRNKNVTRFKFNPPAETSLAEDMLNYIRNSVPCLLVDRSKIVIE